MIYELTRSTSGRRSTIEQIESGQGASSWVFGTIPAMLQTPMLSPPPRRLALAVAFLWIGFSDVGRAEAGAIALSTPAGLSFGETFRFVFITDATTVASSSNIAVYNSFVDAQAGGATYDGSVVNWVAIGSTRSVSAINNVGQTPTPVYLADGTLVTTSTTSTGLWSGSLLNPINEDLSGMGVNTGSTGLWTGTNTNGSASANPLGNFFGVTIGNSLDRRRHLGKRRFVACRQYFWCFSRVRNFAGTHRCSRTINPVDGEHGDHCRLRMRLVS